MCVYVKPEALETIATVYGYIQVQMIEVGGPSSSTDDLPVVVVRSAVGSSAALQVLTVDTSHVMQHNGRRTNCIPRRIITEHAEAQQMQNTVQDASGFMSLATNVNGACGLHATLAEHRTEE